MKSFGVGLATAAALLGGCAAPGPTSERAPAAEAAPAYEGGRFSLAGRAAHAEDRSITFARNAQFRQSASIALAPEAVAEKFGHLCKAKKSCSYFADARAYYLVADYGEMPARSGSISQIACPVVDGASGTLLKIC